MNKNHLRQLFISKRQLLSEAEYESLNSRLLEQFKLINLADVKCIHLFMPIRKRKEPDTLLIRDWLKQNHPEIKRAIPKANFADHTMQSFADDEHLELLDNAFDIPEPINGTIVESSEIDLMLVPLLAFDKRGYRAGYGKGFYDRFMAQCKPGTRFVGLSFFDPVDIIEDIDQYDMKLHQCITPDHILDLPHPTSPEEEVSNQADD